MNGLVAVGMEVALALGVYTAGLFIVLTGVPI